MPDVLKRQDNRYPGLESLRGLAALIVVIHHHLLVFPAMYPYVAGKSGLPGLLTFTPLHLVWAGSEAVVFFFLLSGFVLTLPTWRGETLDMVTFVVRRIWRIWVPLVVVVTVAYLCVLAFGHLALPGDVSVWVHRTWSEAGLEAYVQHLLALGKMDAYNSAFDPVVWSLKWELWASLLLPVVILAARQRAIGVAIGTLLALALYWHHGDLEVATQLLRYLPLFVVGAWLARHHHALVRSVQKLPAWVHALAFVVALLLLPVQWYGWAEKPGGVRAVLNDVGTLTATSILLLLALAWTPFIRALNHRALLWLGRVSYSLYLTHALLLTVVLHVGGAWLPTPALVLISFLLALPVAHIVHLLVERPAINGARRAARGGMPAAAD